MGIDVQDTREWLETDGAGGFASGTVSGIRTRRYHGLLLTATTPPTGRMLLVNGVDVWVDTASGSVALSSSLYAPGVVHPDGHTRLTAFTNTPWPTWTFDVGDGMQIVQEVLVTRYERATILKWTQTGGAPGSTLRVRPFFSCRDYHALCHANDAFRFEPECTGSTWRWRPYDGVPAVQATVNGKYRHAPDWYRQFLYAEEHARGLDDIEDLAAPGEFCWPLAPGSEPAYLALTAVALPGTADPVPKEGPSALRVDQGADRTTVASALDNWMAVEGRRRAALGNSLDRAADAYLVRRGGGLTIVAGYPWFTDWGRDTFMALRGLCLATGRLTDARNILLEWSEVLSEGMLPNRFPDGGDTPEYNAVDASLWFVIAVHELERLAAGTRVMAATDRRRLDDAVDRMLDGYTRGTRFAIRCAEDGLLRAGVPGVQLTWMDAKVGDWVVTPRIGKPVDVNALWINALRVGAHRDTRWRQLCDHARASFVARFWNDEERCLFDVVDVDHVPGRVDGSIRPNQILSVGGLPFACLDGERARQVVARVERDLLTPIGLRSLAPGSAGYSARYEGGVHARDGAYHQGTVWPWLMEPFVDAWLNVNGRTAANQQEARERFVMPLMEHLQVAGLGHVSEITDAAPPFTPRGCPFQAWSLGALLRLTRVLLPEGVSVGA